MVQDAGDALGLQIDRVAIDDPVIAVLEARHAGAQSDAVPHGGPYGRVHAGGVSPAGDYSDMHGVPLPVVTPEHHTVCLRCSSR